MLAAVLFFPGKVSAISAERAILLDAQTGRVLYEKNADQRSLIASTTKIMTALIVAEQCNVLDRMRIPKEAVGIEGSSMYLREGEILTIQDLLYGLMLQSGNDAAVALAIYCAGTVEGFSEIMNDKAHRLGLHNTHFSNPHGLDSPNHYSTSKDMAKLAAYAMKNPIFSQTVRTKTVYVAGRYLRNHNKLLWLQEGADGVKTGYTKAAGRILVSSAVEQDRRLIAVTMNAPNDWQDHMQLFNMGFDKFTLQRLFSKGDYIATVDVVGGVQRCVDILSAEDFDYAITESENVSIMLPGAGFTYAPTVKGQDAGFVYVCVDGHAVSKMAVKYAETVEQNEKVNESFWSKIFGGSK